MIITKSDDLSGIIHVEKRGLLLILLSIAPQPVQNTCFRAHDGHVMCVDIDTHISVLLCPAKQENKF